MLSTEKHIIIGFKVTSMEKQFIQNKFQYYSQRDSPTFYDTSTILFTDYIGLIE